MAKQKEDDCPMNLINLVNKPAEWRLEASKCIIDIYHRVKNADTIIKASIAINAGVLALVIELTVRHLFGG